MKLMLKHKGQVQELELSQGGVLLDLLLDGGLKYPFGCRESSCGVCRVLVTHGQKHLDPPGVSEEDTLARCMNQEGVRLACCTRLSFEAGGSVTLEDPPPVVLPPEDAEQEK